MEQGLINEFDYYLNFLLDIYFMKHAPRGTMVRVQNRRNDGPYDATIQYYRFDEPDRVLWAAVLPLANYQTKLLAYRHELIIIKPLNAGSDTRPRRRR